MKYSVYRNPCNCIWSAFELHVGRHLNTNGDANASVRMKIVCNRLLQALPRRFVVVQNCPWNSLVQNSALTEPAGPIFDIVIGVTVRAFVRRFVLSVIKEDWTLFFFNPLYYLLSRECKWVKERQRRERDTVKNERQKEYRQTDRALASLGEWKRDRQTEKRRREKSKTERGRESEEEKTNMLGTYYATK